MENANVSFVFQQYGHNSIGLEDAGTQKEPLTEDGETVIENALSKKTAIIIQPPFPGF